MYFSVILYTVQLMSQTISEMFLTGSHFNAVVSYKRLLTYLIFTLISLLTVKRSEVHSHPQDSLRCADLHFISPQPDTSLHCQTMDTRLVQVSK